jgi:hypothetical protein
MKAINLFDLSIFWAAGNVININCFIIKEKAA